MSSGEFVGQVADNPGEKIKLKMFHAEIVNDVDQLNSDAKKLKDIPLVFHVSSQQVQDNYYQVKMDVRQMIRHEVEKLKGAKGEAEDK